MREGYRDKPTARRFAALHCRGHSQLSPCSLRSHGFVAHVRTFVEVTHPRMQACGCMTFPHCLSLQVVGGLHHLIRRCDRLGVHFIGALRDDEVDHLGGDVDVGTFQISLYDLAA